MARSQIDHGILLAIAPGTPIDAAAINALGIMAPEAVRTPMGVKQRGVAVVSVDFPLWGTWHYAAVGGALSNHLADPAVAAIVLDFDSPGGTVHGCGELADLIARLGQIKPIYAHVTGRACSAAYLLAAACRDITVSESAEVGCIGTMVAWIDDTVWQEKTGIKIREIASKQTPKKLLDPSTKEGEKRLQAQLDQCAELFIAQLARHRGVSKETILDDYGAGDTFMGIDAVAQGLAERVATLAEMIEQLATRGVLMAKSKGLTVGALYVATSDEDLGVFVLSVGTLATREEGAAIVDAIERAAAATATEAQAAAIVKATAAAVAGERQRIAGLHELLAPGAESAVAEAIASGATPEATALVIVRAQKEAGVTLAEMRSDAPGAVHHTGVSQAAKSSGWDQSAKRIGGRG